MLRGRFSRKVFALTIFALYLFLRVQPKLNLKSIIQPYSGRLMPHSFSVFLWTEYIPWIRKMTPKLRRIKDMPLYRSGVWPGTPCMEGASYDAWYLYHRCDTSLTNAFYTLWKAFMGPLSFKRMTGRLRRLAVEPPEGPHRGMRTSAAQDRGGKTRVFTCANYWLQITLFVIHDTAMKVLREIPEDFTYNADEALERLKAWHKEGRPCYSYDLSSATDRFPLFVQVRFLSA